MKPHLPIAALALLAAACGDEARARTDTPNVVLLVVDTLRADRLGCYGNERPTSPRLDELAREGFLFEDAQSSAPWTAPALATLFTGLYPDAHGVRTFPAPPRLNEALPTMAEVLRAEGYATAAYTEGGYAKSDFGFGQGFEHYERHAGDDESHASNLLFPSRLAANVEKSIAWLRERAAVRAEDGQPFFLFLHTYEPHFPYYPAQRWLDAVGSDVELASEEPALTHLVAEWNGGRELTDAEWTLIARHRFHCNLVDAGEIARPEAFEAGLAARGLLHPRDVASPVIPFVTDLYDAEVASADDQFGRVLDALDELDLAEDTIVVLVSDHGESLGEHGELGHGLLLSNVVLNIVLVIRAPGLAAGPRRIAELARSVDVLPTVLELAGIDAPELGAQGESLVPAMRGESRERVAFSHANSGVQMRGHFHAVCDGRWRYLVSDKGAQRWLYDREADPGETRDVLAEHPEVAARMEELLREQRAADARIRERFPATPLVPGARDVDLEQLGYVGGEDEVESERENE